ncbi:MAG: class I lanthipeptide [Mediterranea sp.]|jgi:natural product precursor|nr:class I lanthipeptide [Mediterranea sp.]
MKNSKELKRLSLKKEEIVNLNDQQMQSLHGGTWGGALKTIKKSSRMCIEGIIEASIAVYTWFQDGEGEEDDAPVEVNYDDMGNISEKMVWLGKERFCELPEVFCYGYKP